MIIPDTFQRTAENKWEQRIAHFNDVAAVNSWSAEDKLKWLEVRLTGRAQIAFQNLTKEDQADFAKATKALKERFEPASRKHQHEAQLQARRRKKGENWTDFAEDLKALVEKAYPDFQAEARERLALKHFLSQLDNPQVAFAVKQRTPANLDAAVSTTLEIKSYLPPKQEIPVSCVRSRMILQSYQWEQLAQQINSLPC